MTRRYKQIICLLLTVLITGCDGGDTNQAAFDKAKARALTSPDAWKAIAELNAAAPDWRHKDLLDMSQDNDNAQDRQARELAMTLYRKALDQGSMSALSDLFTRSDLDESRALHTLYAAAFLDKASALKGTKADGTILMAAGNVLSDGEWALKNTSRAAAFYARAWAAGEPMAAAKLWALYAGMKDPASALLWGLRCTGECLIDREEVQQQARAFLSTAQMTQIQMLAADRNHITVNGLRTEGAYP